MFAIYLLLGAGIFMGWSLGTNDGANAFGTAVATGVVKYRTAIIIIAIFVIIGAAWLGEGNIGKLDELSQLNGVSATEEVAPKGLDATRFLKSTQGFPTRILTMPLTTTRT